MKVKCCNHESHQTPAKRLKLTVEGLRERGIRVTKPRQEILGVLARAQHPLSSEEVYARLPAESSDVVTVYRTLASLAEASLLQRHDLGDQVRRYEIAGHHHHHHYVRCRSCDKLEPFDGCDFETTISKTLEQKGFRVLQHSLEVQALCKTCQ